MAYLERQQTQIRDTTSRADVPNSDIAKIMYYLNCVCYCIDYNDNDIRRYTNYARWASLSDEEDRLVFVLGMTLSPDLFIGKVFFPSDALSRDMTGRFYEISQINHQLVVVPSLVIGGRTCRVNRILAYKQVWLQENYIDPMRRLIQRFRPQQQATRSCSIS
ncbi:unnamed protein product [Rotaria magnacalcarata]|uniref:Uncharacterized protein n=1 Tax=Rotaria magnacalcarata TaxID=392030 RepID=A0A816WH29_9BILA|nr:unnamed protein product [Rotaria magnacalcarata]CAF1328060.1 unnamed protein product [Rotaria magnacalcarata]CAF2135466.1 unnamed protein product [Rotaria magnacalcarata]CAF3774740.1 unnamed protein product [Rotaria magnacalcarata]CAF3815686.1 unnamed protein product [Rotaria magnacalcarata]